MKEDHPNYSEHEIVEGIKNNNEVIITYLIKRLHPSVDQWITKYHYGTEEQAQDVLQDTWLAVISNIRQGKYKEGNFEGYFISISKYIWFKMIKKTKKIPDVENSTYENVKDHSEEEFNLKILKDKRHEIVYQKLMELKEEPRNLLFLRYYDNETPQEISEKECISKYFVKVKLYRCRKYLLNLLRKEPEFSMETYGRSRKKGAGITGKDR